MEFEYIVLEKNGKRTKSFMKADSAAAVASALRGSEGKLLKITPLKKQQARSFLEDFVSSQKQVKTKELAVFTRQLGTILNAGILLSEAIETIASDMENRYFADVLAAVLFHIKGGESFSHALSYHPQVFSSYYVAIVGSGEAVGRLGSTIVSMASYMEEEERMRLKFLGAIRYPIFLISFVFCIVSGIVLFLIPKFKTIFEGAGVKLPLLTQIVVGISEFSLHYIVFVVLGVIMIAFAVWWALQTFPVRFMADYMLLRVPIVGKVIRKALIARFCQTFSMLLEGGVGIIAAISLSTKVMTNFYLKHTIAEIGRNVEIGTALSDAMGSQKDMPRILVKMVAVGEKSGKLSDMIKRMGDYYDEEVETFLNNINSLLEPIFIVIIGAVVLVVALALYLPIFKMSSVVH